MSQGNELKRWNSPRKLLRAILMLDDTRHAIALGTTVGMFIGMTPTVGIQMILVVLFAFVTSPFFRFNRVAALLTVYISNPITLVPIYWFNYKVGTLFVSGNVIREDFERILTYESFDQWWLTMSALFVDIGTPLTLGSLVVATVCAITTYPAMRWLLGHEETSRIDIGSPESAVCSSAKEKQSSTKQAV